ncbi:nascent polypeptide-associated complex subunit alpha, muscle-specific form [Brachypodium distachyon]|uniref:LisH domain-containing protein n=1 Tax=Brachypodium distachyon TaxID=15368 RepID=A0A0Q3LE70_BRADI|nr:nascent polypeptide-associated complex subunit alpha, muscle-specific form [Brachypodium distachyon]KQK21265.1 hypothetical protein BRADI_1g59810v3 [Brachypodium distachyon]|eukprot:XP_010230130.1 nascent polypeptide-associated complex subunit alpha, muscle-specific form [Brachypodium distachyon]
MAPPKPSSPPNPNPSDAADKGKKKVTPLQVAFLVERYLADNGFAASLAAFRADAASLFGSRNAASSNPPKGLLPLADILHDYISLKESRLAVDSAMHAMHSLVSAYYQPNPLLLAAGPPPSSPPLVPPFFVRPNASSPPAPPPPQIPMPPPPPAGIAGYATPMLHYTQTSSSLVVQNSSNANNMSTPAVSSLPTKKRKVTKSAAKSTSASKRICTAPTTSLNPTGKNGALQLPTAQPSSAEHSGIAKLPAQGSSVAKSLFKPLQPQVSSSPCTPQQSHPIGDEPASHQAPRPSSSVAPNVHTHQEIASSQCSIVSSKTLIVSPLKGGSSTYYSVERSYHVSSPLKSSTQKTSKREHVKGRLDFDSSDARPGSTELTCDKATNSTSDGQKQDDFDIDFTNFDIFDGDFSLSELLLDFDLDNVGVHCENPSSNAEVQRLQPIASDNNVMADPVFPNSVKPMTADPTEDINSQGATSVTSVRAITKRIKIVSPVKGRKAS